MCGEMQFSKQAKRFVHGDDPSDITEAIKVRGSSTDKTKILKKIQKCFVTIHKINNDEGIRDENERFILTSIFTQYGLSLIEERQVKIFLEHNGGMDKEIQDMFTYQLGLNPKENRVVLLGNCLRVKKLCKQTQQQLQQQQRQQSSNNNFRQGRKREEKRGYWPRGAGTKK